MYVERRGRSPKQMIFCLKRTNDILRDFGGTTPMTQILPPLGRLNGGSPPMIRACQNSYCPLLKIIGAYAATCGSVSWGRAGEGCGISGMMHERHLSIDTWHVQGGLSGLPHPSDIPQKRRLVLLTPIGVWCRI